MNRAIRILIVEDDLDFAESLAVYLGMEGHDVTCAESGEAGLALFESRPFDVTFMDVRLPGMDGVRTFMEFRRHRPGAQVIMMTAFSVEDLITQAIEAGALALLRKPFDPAELIAVIDGVLRGAR